MLVAGLAHTTAVATDRVRTTTTAWALATQLIEADIPTGCQGPLSATFAFPRVLGAWSDIDVGARRERTVDISLTASPLAAAALRAPTAHLTTQAAWSCP